MSLLDSELHDTTAQSSLANSSTRTFSWSAIAQGLDDSMDLDDLPPPSLTRLTMLRERLRQQRVNLGLDSNLGQRNEEETEPTLGRSSDTAIRSGGSTVFGDRDPGARRRFTFVAGRGIRARYETEDDSDDLVI